VCGGARKEACRKGAALQLDGVTMLANTRNWSMCNGTNNASNTDCFVSSSPALVVAAELECGGNFRHGQGHLAGDGSLILQCRGAVQRMCCASCAASIVSDASFYPCGNVSLLIQSALRRALTTRLWCVWYVDMHGVEFPGVQHDKRSGVTSNAVLISTLASYDQNASDSEGQRVLCSAPGAEFDLPAMHLSVCVVQEDTSSSLHFCG